jgi:hypothetical protein
MKDMLRPPQGARLLFGRVVPLMRMRAKVPAYAMPP